jgi:cytochrome c556
MNSKAGILAFICMGIACTGLVACGGGGSDPNSPEYQAYMQRQEAMDMLGEAILVLNDMSAEDIPVDEAAFRAAAETIAAGAATLLDEFENQTIVPESRTKPEVFQNWDDFAAKNAALETAANALVAATASGGFAAGRGLVVGVRDSCGGCHRPYRAPEQE